MSYQYGDSFPWIKFAILSIPGIIIMVMFAPTLKWKLLFALCVPVGVWFALLGKSINVHKRR